MSAKLKLKTLTKSGADVASPLSATDLWVRQLTIQCLSSGTNETYVGDSTVTSATGFLLAAGASLSIDPNHALTRGPQQINLKDIYVICATGETSALVVMYLIEDPDPITPV